MDIISNLNLLSVGAIVAAIGILGFLLYFNHPKSVTSRTFLYLSFSIIAWSVFNYLASYQAFGDFLPIWYLRLVMFSAIWFAFFLYKLSYVFPEENTKLGSIYKFVSIPAVIITAILTLTPLVFSSVISVKNGQIAGAQSGTGILFFALVAVGFLGASVLRLIRKTINSTGLQRTQFRLMTTGFSLTFFLLIIFNFILPAFLGNSTFVNLGAVFIFPFVGLTFYAIYRYGLLNVKVISVSVLTFTLAVISFAEVLFSINGDLPTLLFRVSIFILILVFGISLIKGVLREVEQRELIQSLAKNLENANQNLEVANQGQENLIHVMNHQIKGYLGKNRVIFAELLTGDYGSMPDTAKPLLTEGFDQSTKGVEYVQDILRGDSAHKGTLPYDMKPMDVKSLVLGLLQSQKETAEGKGLSFESNVVDGNYNIIGDAAQLGEAFKNLMTNAIKYNSPNGSIKVELVSKDDKVIFSVKDSGVGISDEDKPKIFTPGGMGKNSIKINTDAAGFGLAFVKGVIETHKGIVGFRSNDPEKGTTFFAELPIARV